MLKVDPSLNHVPAKREHVVALLESINQPLVNIPSHGTASTGAFILGTRNEHGYYTVFVYLHQPETKAVVIYVSEPRNLTGEQFQGEQDEALRFVESMGFMIDDIKFPTLSPSEQESVVSRVPLFRPPERTVDLYDVADSLSVEESTEPSTGQGSVSPPSAAPGPAAVQGAPISGPRVPFTPGSGAPVPGHPQSGSMAIPGTPTSGLNVPLSGGFPPTVQGMPASSPSSGYPQSNPGYPQSNPGPSNGQDVEALKRIARLLSSFSWLLALGWALAACQTPRQVDQRAVDSQVDLGTQHLARGSWADAVRAYQQALTLDPKSQQAARGLGVAYLKLERFDKAEEHLRQAMKLAPDWSMPKNELAVVLIAQERCAEALPVLDQVLEDIFYPTPEYAEHNRARALNCVGRTEEAVAQLEELLRKKPKFCLGYLTLSEMATESRRYEATIRACDGFVRH